MHSAKRSLGLCSERVYHALMTTRRKRRTRASAQAQAIFLAQDMLNKSISGVEASMQAQPRIDLANSTATVAPAGLSGAALRHGLLPMPDLRWTPEVERETA